jgi:hypothetical protein
MDSLANVSKIIRSTGSDNCPISSARNQRIGVPALQPRIERWHL